MTRYIKISSSSKCMRLSRDNSLFHFFLMIKYEFHGTRKRYGSVLLNTPLELRAVIKRALPEILMTNNRRGGFPSRDRTSSRSFEIAFMECVESFAGVNFHSKLVPWCEEDAPQGTKRLAPRLMEIAETKSWKKIFFYNGKTITFNSENFLIELWCRGMK